MKTYTIEGLKTLGDDEMRVLLGQDRELATFHEGLDEANALKGKARQEFEEELNRMLSPKVYVNELDWMIERAKEKADPKAMRDSKAPGSVL